MSLQNVWATIMPFGPVTNFFYWPKIFFRASLRLALISGTALYFRKDCLHVHF